MKICFPLKCHSIYLQLINKYDLFIQVPLIPGQKLCTGCRKHTTQTRAPSFVSLPSSSTTSGEESVCEPETEEIYFVNIDDLNESLSPLGISIFKKKKIGMKRYSCEKAKKVDEVLRKKLRLSPAKDPEPEPVHPAFVEMLEQLKEKFYQSEKTSEKSQVLTALPKSWGIKKVIKKFRVVGATQHMIRRAKALVQKKGILSNPNQKAGKTLLEETARLVKEFYKKDELSRMMPGKKDCFTMKIDGVKQTVQKRLLLCNLI